MNYRFLLIAASVIFLFYACNRSPRTDVQRDTTVNIYTSFNNLFLDSGQIEKFLIGHEEYKNYKKQFKDFYKARNYEYAWFDTSGIGEQAGNFVNLLNNTISDFEDSSFYNKKLFDSYNTFINNNGAKHRYSDVVNTELLLTGQFFNYADKIYKGTDSNVADLGWFIPRKKIDLTAILDSVIVSKTKQADEFAPMTRQYKKLESFIPLYYRLQKSTSWDSITKPDKPLHEGDHGKIIFKIKDKLNQLGDLPFNDSTNSFDTALFVAVKKFQRRMGLAVDGAIGPNMISELNITPTQRIQQIFVNLERMRWMPSEAEPRHIFVNIPEYKMYVYDSSKFSFAMNVIVGTTANSTVIFSGDLKYIVFSPYWRVPNKIIRTEILPAMKKDTGYLRKHNMVRLGGVDTMPAIRQDPGPNNSLGKVKFLFPNNYDIYFHDTPDRDLFNQSNRSFSHGCIRIGEPKHLAQFLLQSDTSWNSYRIDTCMNNTKETWVSLQHSVPVVIAYFTAWVDSTGQLNFRKDIYGHDARLANKLFVKTP